MTQQPPDPASRWGHSQLATELADIGISASQIGRILADLDIKPHRVRSWITRPQDPGFWERAADVCALYLVPPTNALVLSVDEKTGSVPAAGPGRPSRWLRGARPAKSTSTSATGPRSCWPPWMSTGAGSSRHRPGPQHHYTPSHASWLNQVELFFSILARRLLRRSEFASVRELVERIIAFIAEYNRTAKPFRWTYDGRPLQAA